MKIIDEHYKTLTKKQKEFLGFIMTGFFTIAVISYILGATNGFGSLTIFILGLIFMGLMKLEYRIETLEKKKK